MHRVLSFFLFVLILLAPLRLHARVIVTELMWAGSDRSTADEWVELVYLREDGEAQQQSMSGWTLTTLASDAEQVMVRFGSGVILEDGDILLIANDHADNSRLSIDADIVTTAVSLPNTKLLVRLRDQDGVVVDVVDDGSGAPLAGANPSGAGKASMERVDLLASGTGAGNWRTAEDSQNFDPGVSIFGTPGVVVILSAQEPVTSSSVSSAVSSEETVSANSSSGQTLAATGVLATGSDLSSSVSSIQEEPIIEPIISVPHIYITEVLADPIGTDAGEWIELWNAEERDVSLAGLSIEKVGSSTSYQFPLAGTGVVLPAGGYLSIHRDVSGITLDNEGADIVLRWNGEFLDALRYDKTDEGVSVGRPLGELLTRQPYCVPTEAQPNTDLPLDPQIATQTLVVHDDGSVALNVEAQVTNASIETVTCEWDYADGTHASSCNPPSHTFRQSGTYSVILSMKSYCGNTVIRTLPINVQMQISSSPGRSLSASSQDQGEESCVPSAQSGVVIERLLPRPETDDEERVVLRNVSDAAIDLCKWSVDDADGGSRGFRLDGKAIPAHATLEVSADESGIHWNDDGDSVRLFAPVQDGQLLVADVAYQHAERGVWLVRLLDGSYDWEASSQQFATLANAPAGVLPSASADEVELIRVMPHPSGAENEWIELRSLAAAPRSLSGWLLDTGTKRQASLRGLIAAGETLQLSGTTIKLRDTDGVVRLIAPDGTVVGVAAWSNAAEAAPVAALVIPQTRSARFVSLQEDGTILLDENGEQLAVSLAGIRTPFSAEWPLPWDEGRMLFTDSIRALMQNKNTHFFLENSDATEARIFVAGREVQDVLLSEGLAIADSVNDDDLADAYDVFESLAKADEKGLWGMPDQAAAVAASRKSVSATASSSSKKRTVSTTAAVTRRTTSVAVPSLKLTAATLLPSSGSDDSASAAGGFPHFPPAVWMVLFALPATGGGAAWLYRWR